METAKQFLTAVAENESLAKELEGAANREEIISIAGNHGYSLGNDDLEFLKEASKANPSESLSDEELELVSGGFMEDVGSWLDGAGETIGKIGVDVWYAFENNL